jgi:hypothetical protein
MGSTNRLYRPINMGNTLTMPSCYFKKVFSKSLSANLIQATQAMAW